MAARSARWVPGGAAALATVLLLAGCTGEEPGPGNTGGGSASSSATGGSSSATADSSTSTTTPAPSGPSPEELSEQVLDTAEQAAQVQVLGSATGPMHAGFSFTVEVTKVERVTDATLVEMRWSTTGKEFAPNPSFVNNERSISSAFARGVFLEDPTVTQTRYLPWQFTNARPSCTCPNLRMTLGPDPVTVYALYPELPPEVSTVNLQVGETAIVVKDLTVSG